MPRKSLVPQTKLEEAISILIEHPKLTVRQVMLAAEFTPQEANDKAMQWKVARSLPGQSKGGLITATTVPLIVEVGTTPSSGVFPLAEATRTELNKESFHHRRHGSSKSND